jgi:ABC-type lipoprotein release transport system permease subunit
MQHTLNFLSIAFFARLSLVRTMFLIRYHIKTFIFRGILSFYIGCLLGVICGIIRVGYIDRTMNRPC